MQKYIFPDGELTPVSEVNAMAENAGFEVRDVENLREHYALTAVGQSPGGASRGSGESIRRSHLPNVAIVYVGFSLCF